VRNEIENEKLKTESAGLAFQFSIFHFQFISGTPCRA
jgi:hypothetical protein